MAGGAPSADACCTVRSRASEIPSQQMLDELRNRLLQRDDCFPDCASVTGMDIRITPDELTITMQVHSRIDTAVPLPGNGGHWLPVRGGARR